MDLTEYYDAAATSARRSEQQPEFATWTRPREEDPSDINIKTVLNYPLYQRERMDPDAARSDASGAQNQNSKGSFDNSDLPSPPIFLRDGYTSALNSGEDDGQG